MKRLTKQQLRELHIFNPHNLAREAGCELYIGYSPADYGRAAHSASWDIIGINFKTDPNGAWYNYGHKSFPMYGRSDKESQLKEAMQWVKKNYGITDWERDVFGSYQIKGTLERLASRIQENRNGIHS